MVIGNVPRRSGQLGTASFSAKPDCKRCGAKYEDFEASCCIGLRPQTASGRPGKSRGQTLFTFLDQPGVPFDNNHAERSIRPAVIIRKNSYGNRSEQGADTQAVLMSIFRTLRQRGYDAIKTVTDAITNYLQTG